MTDIFIKLSNPTYNERSSFTATVYGRDSSNAAEAPTTIHYRIDDLTTNTVITDWTSVSPAVSVDISITPTENRMISNRNKWERRQITVSADKGTSTETRDVLIYKILNIGGFDE